MTERACPTQYVVDAQINEIEEFRVSSVLPLMLQLLLLLLLYEMS